MDKIAKDYKFFRDHFYPNKKAEEPSVAPCPFCGSKASDVIDKKRVCKRCGKQVG